MKKMLFTAIMLLVAVLANAKDIKTVVLTTDPGMKCESCAARIKDNLKYCKGVKDINISVEKQAIAIQYDADKTNPEAFIKSLKKINFTATEKTCGEGKCKNDSECKKEEAKSCCK